MFLLRKTFKILFGCLLKEMRILDPPLTISSVNCSFLFLFKSNQNRKGAVDPYFSLFFIFVFLFEVNQIITTSYYYRKKERFSIERFWMHCHSKERDLVTRCAWSGLKQRLLQFTDALLKEWDLGTRCAAQNSGTQSLHVLEITTPSLLVICSKSGTWTPDAPFKEKDLLDAPLKEWDLITLSASNSKLQSTVPSVKRAGTGSQMHRSKSVIQTYWSKEQNLESQIL